MMGETWRLLVQGWLMKNRALYLNVNVFRKKVLSKDIIFTPGRVGVWSTNTLNQN